MVTKRFNTYIGREMLARLLHFPYMTDREFRALPPTPNSGCKYSRLQDHQFINSFLCMIFYRYSSYSMSALEPTGNCIRGIIHRDCHFQQRTYLLFTDQVFSYQPSTPPLRMLRLLIRAFGQIDLHNLPHALVEDQRFDLALYRRMVHECYPDEYVVSDEHEARRRNHSRRRTSFYK